ncbi:MAG: AAA family ATPase [Akkermansiaceae bacterium]|nr:AAA family ATPase [Akkermansiaceae bacterium]
MPKYKSTTFALPLPNRTLDYLANGAPEGSRNAELFDATCQLRDAGQSITDAESCLLARAVADGLSDTEARNTIHSAFNGAAREPLAPTPRGQDKRQPSRHVTGPPEAIEGGFLRLLETCFQPDEFVAIAPAAESDEGGIVPRRGVTLTASEWKSKIEAKGGIDRVFSTKLGLFLRINPMAKDGAKNEDVTTFRHALVEFDCDETGNRIPKADQYQTILESGMPVAALIDSGNKSLHAWIRVDARDAAEYKRRVEVIWKHFAGKNLDTQNRNPSRLSRCPDGRRTVDGEVRHQRLLATNFGAASWDAWVADHAKADPPPGSSSLSPAPSRNEAVERFYYDGNARFHLDTGDTLVPMDQRSVENHLKSWGIADGKSIAEMVCSIQTGRFVRRTEDIQLTGATELLDRAYALSFDPQQAPPEDELCLCLGDYPVAAHGNLTCIQGKSKVGKSAVIAAILGACQRGNYACSGDTLCFKWQGGDGGAIIHLDTEQSGGDWHALVRRSVQRSGMPAVSTRLVSLPLVRFARSERLAILELALEKELQRQGGIDIVIIDGVADLCSSPNDEAESLELISRLHALAQEYRAAIICVLHENPSSVEGKTRGHLGSELNRKAFANLRIEKDPKDSISTMWGMDMRKRDIPREQGFCFAWNEDLKMHSYYGRWISLKIDARKQKSTEDASEKWTTIFAKAAESGTDDPCPVLSAEQALQIIRDIDGTESAPKQETVKKQMQRAEVLGILRKTERGKWVLNPSGQTGQDQDT